MVRGRSGCVFSPGVRTVSVWRRDRPTIEGVSSPVYASTTAGLYTLCFSIFLFEELDLDGLMLQREMMLNQTTTIMMGVRYFILFAFNWKMKFKV